MSEEHPSLAPKKKPEISAETKELLQETVDTLFKGIVELTQKIEKNEANAEERDKLRREAVILMKEYVRKAQEKVEKQLKYDNSELEREVLLQIKAQLEKIGLTQSTAPEYVPH